MVPVEVEVKMSVLGEESPSENESINEPPRLPNMSSRKRSEHGSVVCGHDLLRFKSQMHPDRDLIGETSASNHGNGDEESDDSCGDSDGDDESECEDVSPLPAMNSCRARSFKTTESKDIPRTARKDTTATPAHPRTSILETPRSRCIQESLSPSDGRVAGMEVTAALKKITSLLNTVVKNVLIKWKMRSDCKGLLLLVNLKAVQPRRKHRFQEWLRYVIGPDNIPTIVVGMCAYSEGGGSRPKVLSIFPPVQNSLNSQLARV